MSNVGCLAQALSLIDAANALDPNLEQGRPKELLYSERMSEMLARFAPQADDIMRLAVRAQHIRRWTLPRGDYAATREGYLAWRTALYKFHAQTAGELMRQAGCAEAEIERAMLAIGKRGIKVNADAQLLEDIASLVFIEHYMLPFAGSKPDYSEEKWLGIIRKTWKKMSAAARDFALSGALTLPAPLVPLITKSLHTESV